MSKRKIETVRVDERDGYSYVYTDGLRTTKHPCAILVHLADDEPAVGEMAVNTYRKVFEVADVEVMRGGRLRWYDSNGYFYTDCKRYTPPTTVEVPRGATDAMVEAGLAAYWATGSVASMRDGIGAAINAALRQAAEVGK